MSKTKKELDELKATLEALNEKLQGLTSEELEQVIGGFVIDQFKPYNATNVPAYLYNETQILKDDYKN